MKIKNKNILVTGVGKGLGRNMVESFSKNGAFVYGITRSKSDLKFFKNLKNVKIFCGDVRNSSIFKKILRQSEIDKRPISGLVNNAGIRQRKKFSQITKKKIKEIFDINFFSVFEYSQMYVKYVKKYKISSSVVNIGSIVGETGFKELSGYSSTKGAIKSLTQCLALEYIKDKIRFNVVSPGFIETSYFKNFKRKKKLYNWTLSKIPMRRWGKSNEISKLVGFLLSDKSYYITGETINIDGGWIDG